MVPDPYQWRPGAPGAQGGAFGTGRGAASAPGPGPRAQAPAPGGLLTNPRFVRGALIGAAATWLLTNEQVQQAAIRALVRFQASVQGGFEELKERFRDAEAELHAAQPPDAD